MTDSDEDNEPCMVCGVADDAETTTILDGQGSELVVHWRCIAALRQLALTNLTNTAMIPQLKPSPRPAASQPQRQPSHGRMKEQRESDYAATPNEAMDKLARAMARTVIRECGLPDETETWRRLSGRFREVAAAAYQLGFEDGERVAAQR